MRVTLNSFCVYLTQPTEAAGVAVFVICTGRTGRLLKRVHIKSVRTQAD